MCRWGRHTTPHRHSWDRIDTGTGRAGIGGLPLVRKSLSPGMSLGNTPLPMRTGQRNLLMSSELYPVRPNQTPHHMHTTAHTHTDTV